MEVPERADSQRLYHLEGLRGLASWAVAVGHMLNYYWPQNYYRYEIQEQIGTAFLPFIYSPLNFLVNGRLGVMIFFVHSGIVLSLKHERNFNILQLRGDAMKRYFRLMIPALASVLLAYFLMTFNLISQENPSVNPNPWVLGQYHFEPSFFGALEQGVWTYFMRTVDPSPLSYNSSLWTLQIELWGSFILFAYIALGPKLRGSLAVLIFAILVGCYSYFSAFLMGLLITKIFFRAQKNRPVSVWLSLFILLMGICIGTLKPAPFWPGSVQLDIWGLSNFVSGIGASLIIIGVTLNPFVKSFLSSKPIVYLGKISFSVYLIHIPLLFSVGYWAQGFLAARTELVGDAVSAGALIFCCGVVLLIAHFVFLPLDQWTQRLANRIKEVSLRRPVGTNATS